MGSREHTRAIIDKGQLPSDFPTHAHSAEFWEWLGRVVATFGFLEEVLGKAIFAFTATRPYEPVDCEKAYRDWLPTLERALTDPLRNLINAYGKAVRAHPDATILHLEDLLQDLREAATVRNVLCHGSWGAPDSDGRSVPLFVNRQIHVFETAVDIHFLMQVQQHAAGLACAVVSTVTHMGWQFPGSNGPGKPIWPL